MSNLSKLTPADFKRAAVIKEKIEALQAELEALLGAAVHPTRRPSKFSAAGLERIRAAQRARWARVRALTGGGGSAAKTEGARKTGGRNSNGRTE